jgi:hypothetical protein
MGELKAQPSTFPYKPTEAFFVLRFETLDGETRKSGAKPETLKAYKKMFHYIGPQ